ncbi:MAG: HAMP domain-containing sensor histidine kinase [Desulfobacteraceae bacterium]
MRFATLITTFIVSAFVLITVLTSTVVYYTVDSTFEKGQERFIQRQLHNVRSMFINYVDTRERLVNDYAKFPMIRLGARHPESTRRIVNDFMDTLRFFGEKHQFVMLDRRGNLIHKTLDTPVPDMKGTGLLNRVKDSAKGGFSEIVKHDGEFFLNILAPVKDKDLVNGFFGCLLPVRLMVETLELQKGDGINMHVSIRKNDLVIARAGGEAEGLTRTVEFMPPDYLISLSISDGFREEANHSLVISLVLFRVCLAGLLIVGVLALMHRWIVQPLHIFGDMADQWGRGEAPETGSYRFWLKEFKDFRKQFEHMHARLLKREADLKKKTEELEAANERIRQDQSILIRQEKLSSIGQLAAGVAHELNTPISFVYSNFEIMEGYLNSIKKVITEYEEKLDEEVVREIRGRYDMDYIMEDIESLVPDNLEGLVRVTDIVSTLKDFSRVDQTDRFSLVNIEDSIRTTLEVARNEIKYVAEVTTRFGGVGQVMCRADEINQVFLNIIVNAAQAVKEAGKTERGEILIETWEEDTAVCCSITDTGPGIPDEVIDKVFDPFYTTKPVGKGTGLGLNIAYDIVVNRHKGRLKVENSDRGGACFTVSLPLNPDTQPLLQKEDNEGYDHRDS